MYVLYELMISYIGKFAPVERTPSLCYVLYLSCSDRVNVVPVYFSQGHMYT